jgi:hypothetical protein
MMMVVKSVFFLLTQSRDQTDTETSKETTSEEQGDGSGNRLQDNAQVEDPGGDHERGAAAEDVGEQGGGEGAEERAGGEDGDDGRLLGGGDVEVAVGVAVASTEEVFPVGHGHDAADGAGVVSVEEGDGRG